MSAELASLPKAMNFGHCLTTASIQHGVMESSERGGCALGIVPQKHFLWTIVGPDSSYSPLEIHICWKVLSEDRMEPPIHTEYFRSGGATTLIFMVEGASAVSSLVTH